MRLVVAVEKELAQLNQREVDTEVAGDDDNEIGEGADGEMNENAVVCCYLRVTATPRFARACVFVCQDSRLDKRRVTNIAVCYASKVGETQVSKSTTLLHESRRGSDHTQNTSIWSDQRLTPIM